MKTYKIRPTCLWLVMISIVYLSSACTSQPPAETLTTEPPPIVPSTPAQPTTTVPPPTSTPTPTATPVPGQMSFLPSPADVPTGSEWLSSFEAQHPFNNPTLLDILQSRYYSDSADGWFTIQMQIATSPFEKGDKGLQLDGKGTFVDTVPVGQFSVAYLLSEDPIRSDFRFFKGNILVILQGSITIDDAVKLAQIIEARLPENLTVLTPITFPDTLDPVAATQFDNWMMGECTPDNDVATPMTVIGGGFGYCLHYDWVGQEPYNDRLLEYAVYDLKNQAYVIKYSSAHESGMLFLPGMPGNYELRVAKGDVLIAVLPFEVR